MSRVCPQSPALRRAVFATALAGAASLLAACSDSTASDALTDPTAGAACSIPTSRIFDGGPGRDGIPALNLPEVVPAGAASFFRDEDRVLGLELNGAARAYPLLVLWWHEVVNDTLGGEPVLLSYCPLTGSGIAFDPVLDGETRNFGVSGLLFENNLIMFDRQTESLWNQLLLGAQCGPDRGRARERLPLVETTWGQWRSLHPNTTVVDTSTGFDRSYGTYPYGTYDQPDNPVTLFPSSTWSDARPPKELVLGIHEGDSAVAYPFGVLAGFGAAVALNDSIAGRPILVTYLDGTRTARAFDRTLGDTVLTFRLVGNGPQLQDAETGSTWNALGEAIAGPLAGRRLSPLVDAYTLFWFAWSVYYPDSRLFGQ